MASNPVAEIPASTAKPTPNSYFLGAHVVYDGVAHKAMVSRLDYPSPAFDAGLRPGDLILALNNASVSKLTRARINALLSPQAPSPVIFKVKRLGRSLSVRVVSATHAKALAKIGRKVTKFGPAAQGCPG
jgi:S1-C subfamily serine protease